MIGDQMANVSSRRSSREIRGQGPGPHAFLSLRRQKRSVAGADTLGKLPKENTTYTSIESASLSSTTQVKLLKAWF